MGEHFTVEYAVATRTFVDGPFDRLDTGREWNSRNGQGYTLEEALKVIDRENENARRQTGNDEEVRAILMTRRVSDWTRSEKSPALESVQGNLQKWR